jgi:hypothetical protein
MLNDNTRWSRISEQKSADGVLRRHRELSMLQLLGACGPANFRMIPHCNRAVLTGRKIARVIGSGICLVGQSVRSVGSEHRSKNAKVPRAKAMRTFPQD